MTSERPAPVPDETSAPYWAAAAEHVLTIPRCGTCGTLALPPDVVCTACGSTDPDYEFTPVSGRGVIRSWTVVRQSFLPGFDVPFVLVDVELEEQADLRVIGRLLDGVDAQLRLGAPVRAAFEDLAAGIAVPAWELIA
jgi:uncharacterized OB-fold protein